MAKILLKRGESANLPALDLGEPGFAIDTSKLYIGGIGGNVEIGTAGGILGIAGGGTGAGAASQARINLGLAIGSDVQAYNAVLSDIAGLSQVSDTLPYFDTATTASTTPLTQAARQLLDDTTTAAMRTTLGLEAGGTGDIWLEKAGDTMDGTLIIGEAANLRLYDRTPSASETLLGVYNQSGTILRTQLNSRGQFSTAYSEIGSAYALSSSPTRYFPMLVTNGYDPGNDPSATIGGLQLQVTKLRRSLFDVYGINAQVTINTAPASLTDFGLNTANRGFIQSSGSAAVSTMYGGYYHARHFSACATTNLIGFQAVADTFGTGGLTTAVGVRVLTLGTGTGTKPTNVYGLYISAQNQGTTNYAIYSEGAGITYLGDRMQLIGSQDVVQSLLRANATQTADILQVQNSAGTNLFRIDGNGYPYFTAQSTGWGPSNITNDKGFDASSITTGELANVLGTLINELITRGVISA